MHSVLLVLKKSDRPDQRELRDFGDLSSIATDLMQRKFQTSKSIGENCWLISLGTDLSMFVELSRRADEAHISYSAIFFDKEPVLCSSG